MMMLIGIVITVAKCWWKVFNVDVGTVVMKIVIDRRVCILNRPLNLFIVFSGLKNSSIG